MSPHRLAVLLCDTPVSSVLSEEGDYVKIFARMMELSKPSGTEFILDGYDVKNKLEYPPKDAYYDAVLLTGSGKILSSC